MDLTVPFSNFLYPILARTGPLTGPGRMRDTDLHMVGLLVRVFFKPLAYGQRQIYQCAQVRNLNKIFFYYHLKLNNLDFYFLLKRKNK
jgi:hypothetical protein